MDRSLKDNLRLEFQEILSRKEFSEKIHDQDLDIGLLKSAFDVLLERHDDDRASAFINNIVNTLKSREEK